MTRAPRSRSRALRVVVALLAACLVGLLAAPAAGAQTTTPAPATPQTTLLEVEKELMCSTCGVPLAQSEAPQAQQERQTIERLIREGLTKDEIIDEMVEIYSESVLLHPPQSSVRTLRWLIPALAALVGFSLVVFLVVRWRRSTRAAAGGGPADPTAGWVDAPGGSPAADDASDGDDAPDDGLTDADRARLDADLDRYA